MTDYSTEQQQYCHAQFLFKFSNQIASKIYSLKKKLHMEAKKNVLVFSKKSLTRNILNSTCLVKIGPNYTNMFQTCARNLDPRVQSVLLKRALGLKIRRCKRLCPKDLQVCAPATPMLTHSLYWKLPNAAYLYKYYIMIQVDLRP